MAIWRRLHDRICGTGRECQPDAPTDRLSAAIREEEYEALRLSVGLRYLVCIAVILLITIELRWPLALHYYGYIGALALSGYLQLQLRKPDFERRWMVWILSLIHI